MDWVSTKSKNKCHIPLLLINRKKKELIIGDCAEFERKEFHHKMKVLKSSLKVLKVLKASWYPFIVYKNF